jgi:hypothetical protein
MVDDFECFEFDHFLEIVNDALRCVVTDRVRTLSIIHAICYESFVDNKYEVVHVNILV